MDKAHKLLAAAALTLGAAITATSLIPGKRVPGTGLHLSGNEGIGRTGDTEAMTPASFQAKRSETHKNGHGELESIGPTRGTTSIIFRVIPAFHQLPDDLLVDLSNEKYSVALPCVRDVGVSVPQHFIGEDCTLVDSSGRYRIIEPRVTFLDDHNHRVTVTPIDSLSIIVLDESGVAVPNALLYLQPTDADLPIGGSVPVGSAGIMSITTNGRRCMWYVTDDVGSVKIASMPSHAVYEVAVTADGFEAKELYIGPAATIEGESAPFEIILTAAAIEDGTTFAVRAEGEAVSNEPGSIWLLTRRRSPQLVNVGFNAREVVAAAKINSSARLSHEAAAGDKLSLALRLGELSYIFSGELSGHSQHSELNLGTVDLTNINVNGEPSGLEIIRVFVSGRVVSSENGQLPSEAGWEFHLSSESKSRILEMLDRVAIPSCRDLVVRAISSTGSEYSFSASRYISGEDVSLGESRTERSFSLHVEAGSLTVAEVKLNDNAGERSGALERLERGVYSVKLNSSTKYVRIICDGGPSYIVKVRGVPTQDVYHVRLPQESIRGFEVQLALTSGTPLAGETVEIKLQNRLEVMAGPVFAPMYFGEGVFEIQLQNRFFLRFGAAGLCRATLPDGLYIARETRSLRIAGSAGDLTFDPHYKTLVAPAASLQRLIVTTKRIVDIYHSPLSRDSEYVFAFDPVTGFSRQFPGGRLRLFLSADSRTLAIKNARGERLGSAYIPAGESDVAVDVILE